MIDQSELREVSLPRADHEFVRRPRNAAAPASRTLGPGGAAGRRGFVVLLASGLALNAWALFPSGVQSGGYVPLPQASPPAAAEVGPAAGGVANPLDLSRGRTFSLMEISLVQSHSMTNRSNSGPYLGPADAVTMTPLRAKLQALLMLLYLRDGDVATALQLKLQSLLRLPDPVLARLVEHPDLADLVTTLDAVFHQNSDLTALKTELDKIDVSSVSLPTEQIDVVSVNGKPAYLVRSTSVPAPAESFAASPRLAMPQPPVEFVVVSQIEEPAEVGALMMAAGVQSFAAEPPAVTAAELPGPTAAEPTALAAAPMVTSIVEPPAPDPAPSVPIVTEVTAAPSETAEPTATAVPTSTHTTAVEEPTDTATTSATDLMKTGNKFEPGDTVAGTQVGNTSAGSTPTSEAASTVAPSEEATHTPPADEGTSAPAADSGAGTAGEVSP